MIGLGKLGFSLALEMGSEVAEPEPHSISTNGDLWKLKKENSMSRTPQHSTCQTKEDIEQKGSGQDDDERMIRETMEIRS